MDRCGHALRQGRYHNECMQRVLVVGGGIIGLATAFRLGQKYRTARITVLEKETRVGQHQTGHNSGVLHSGLYYKPGSLKARMAVEGIREMTRFCEENEIPVDICGKLVLAADDSEVGRLRDLETRGAQNGLAGLRWMTPSEYREIEPHAGGVAALRVPQEGIVDYAAVCAALVRKIEQQGSRVVTGARVQALKSGSASGSEWTAVTTAGEFHGEFLVNCAGLHSDRVAELGGGSRDVRIVPFRGEYYKIRKERESLVRHLIYPVPDPGFPFLGVHFTRRIHGGIEAGPNAVLAFSREGYRKTDFRPADLWDAVTYGGLWRFLRTYPRMCFDELRRSFSRDLFCKSLQRLVPEIQPQDLVEGGSGVRAQAMAPSGELLQDFHFVERDRALHVVNAPSPGATASLAIGGEIAARCEARLAQSGA